MPNHTDGSIDSHTPTPFARLDHERRQSTTARACAYPLTRYRPCVTGDTGVTGDSRPSCKQSESFTRTLSMRFVLCSIRVIPDHLVTSTNCVLRSDKEYLNLGSSGSTCPLGLADTASCFSPGGQVNDDVLYPQRSLHGLNDDVASTMLSFSRLRSIVGVRRPAISINCSEPRHALAWLWCGRACVNWSREWV